ncbi:hypothetical protein HAX54_042060 [Datura stramonium]|uniref:Uncharacterized protein n=1 Tax=Datura stramonium TaxID=4076 RepID=A0ABS8W2V2_DATST|nr:hypothetical protein [Datura stramonium]
MMYVANMYETLVNEVNVRLSSLNGMREKTIGVALEAAGGLCRKLAKNFLGKDLACLKGGSWLHLLKQGQGFPEWFRRMTGRNEVAISPSDYKFYAPRHKYRRASNSISNITGLSEFNSTDNASSLAAGQSYRSVSEDSQQTTLKQHMQPLAHQAHFHPLQQSHHQQHINQSQHIHFLTINNVARSLTCLKLLMLSSHQPFLHTWLAYNN